MIFGIKEKSIILPIIVVLLVIATNIPQWLKTGFVLQGHVLSMHILKNISTSFQYMEMYYHIALYFAVYSHIVLFRKGEVQMLNAQCIYCWFQDGAAVLGGFREAYRGLWRSDRHVWAVWRSQNQSHLPRAFPLRAGEGARAHEHVSQIVFLHSH